MTRLQPDLIEKISVTSSDTSTFRQIMKKEIEKSIRLAEVRCLSFDELTFRIEKLWEYDSASELVYYACSEDFSHNQLCVLAEAARRLAEEVDRLPSARKTSMDRAVKRILSRMPASVAAPIVEPWLDHKRKFRREITYKILRVAGVPRELGAKLLLRFDRTGDQECLHLLARNADALSVVDAQKVLKNTADEYWRMRIFQSLLSIGFSETRNYASNYPREFIWAIGREKDIRFITEIRNIFSENSENLPFLSLYAWTLGQLNAKDDLKKLRNFMDTILD